jgi:FKBP-type peptidyl-prolyl cis-trans isomerase
MFSSFPQLRTTLFSTITTLSTHTPRSFSRTAAIMGVTKTVLKEGNGPIPKVGDKVTIAYTGYLKDIGAPDNKGTQ